MRAMAQRIAPLFLAFVLPLIALDTARAEPAADAMKRFTPEGRRWIASEIQKATKSPNFSADKARGIVSQASTKFATPGSMSNGDIEAIAFLVLMQASKSAQEDLKSVMNKVKSASKEKATLRAHLHDQKKTIGNCPPDCGSSATAVQLSKQQAIQTAKPLTTPSKLSAAPPPAMLRNTGVNALTKPRP
jgi:hypothetical protein